MKVGPGKKIREWTLDKEIGRGAIGVIYQAQHKFDESEYAVKVLRPELSKIEEIRQRFLREAKIITGLKHPNIVESFPAFEEAGRLFLPMELLQGNSLKIMMACNPEPWKFDVVRFYGAKIAAGLSYSHGLGFSHRDVKPGNIFVLLDGVTVKILDFGLAMGEGCERLTATGTTVGTPNYLAPEVIDGDRATALSDIYALGVVLFRLVTKRLPFTLSAGANALAIACEMREQQELGLPASIDYREDCPPELSELIGQMLSFQPEKRPQNLEEVIERLQAPETIIPPEFSLSELELPNGPFSSDGILGIQMEANDQTIGARPSKMKRPTSVAYASTEDGPNPSVSTVAPSERVETSPTEIIRPPTDSEQSTIFEHGFEVPKKQTNTFFYAGLFIILAVVLVYGLFG